VPILVSPGFGRDRVGTLTFRKILGPSRILARGDPNFDFRDTLK
jgi:hypothetical protein